jgi:hypothetical protein
MIELLCSRCETANAVPDETRSWAVRCASCEGDLAASRQVLYLVADSPALGGPQTRRGLQQAVTRGILRPDMWISEEGGPWFRSRERPDLFEHPPRVRAPAAARRRPASRATPRESRRASGAVPGSVLAMAILNQIGGAILLILTIPAFAILASLSGAAALAAVAFLLIPGVVLFGLASGLKKGSGAAQVIQLCFAGLLGVYMLFAIAEGPPLLALLGLGIVALPFFLLLNREAREFFRGGSGDFRPYS